MVSMALPGAAVLHSAMALTVLSMARLPSEVFPPAAAELLPAAAAGVVPMALPGAAKLA